MNSYRQIIIQYHNTEAGELIIGSYQEMICICDWRHRKMRSDIDERIQKGLSADYLKGDSDSIQNTKIQLDEYFKGTRKVFDIPFLLVGTEFQKKVWIALQNIPYGETMSYIQLSRTMGNEKAIRAVASANGANAISILIPCHRIVGSKGELTGYAGGLQAKRKLLNLEARVEGKAQLELF